MLYKPLEIELIFRALLDPFMPHHCRSHPAGVWTSRSVGVHFPLPQQAQRYVNMFTCHVMSSGKQQHLCLPRGGMGINK